MSLQHFISARGFTGMLCARAERSRKNGVHGVQGDWQRTAEGRPPPPLKASPVGERATTPTQAVDASYLRNWFVFSGVCLKSPSNWSLAHWKKRWENLIERQSWDDLGMTSESDSLTTVCLLCVFIISLYAVLKRKNSLIACVFSHC